MNRGAAVLTPRRYARSADIAAIGAVAVALRLVFAPQFDGLDDAGYLEAAQRVSEGRPLDTLFPLFRTRVGMAYPLGWLTNAGALEPGRFWVLTIAADCVTLIALYVAGWLLTNRRAIGVWAAGLYALYPLAVQQSAMYYPTAFQAASIAIAFALVAVAERREGSRVASLAAPLLAGLSLGVGYLFKEDVAIVVPALAAASVAARYPRFRTTALVCAGAAAVFALECAAYWQITGNPLFRLAATSGLGAPTGGQLQIAEIWRWDAFIRSLWLVPVQVGLVWWLAIPAVWYAFRTWRTERAIAFVAFSLLMVMAYLQFGSGSFTSYSPLPKTPRYTALATPSLMLVAAAWLGALQTTRPRRARALAALVAAVAVPCLFYLNVSSSERTRNTLAVLDQLDAAGATSVYTDYYSARILRLLDPRRDVRVWYHARFEDNEMVVVSTPPSDAHSYAWLDRQAAKIYTSSYELPLPEPVAQPPRTWTPVWSHRAYGEGTLTRTLLEGARAAAGRLPNGNPLSSRITRNISDMIDGDQGMLYRVH